MINNLIKLANYLDESGLKKEADYVDSLIKLARGCEDGRFKDYDRVCVSCAELKTWLEVTSLNISEQITSTRPPRAAFSNTRAGVRRYNAALTTHNKKISAYNARHQGNKEIYNQQCSGYVADPAVTTTSGSGENCDELLIEAHRQWEISNRKCKDYNACLSDNGGDVTQCDQTQECYNAIETSNAAVDLFNKSSNSEGIPCPRSRPYSLEQ